MVGELTKCVLLFEQAVWKSVPGWIVLNRRHACEISLLPRCVGDDLVSAWGPGGQWSEDKGGVFAPEEVYFATMLAILGYLRKAPSTVSGCREVALQSSTFAKWRRLGDANPISYASLTAPLLDEIRSSGALFARKFARPEDCRLEDWRRLVLGRTGATVGADERIEAKDEGASSDGGGGRGSREVGSSARSSRVRPRDEEGAAASAESQGGDAVDAESSRKRMRGCEAEGQQADL